MEFINGFWSVLVALGGLFTNVPWYSVGEACGIVFIITVLVVSVIYIILKIDNLID